MGNGISSLNRTNKNPNLKTIYEMSETTPNKGKQEHPRTSVIKWLDDVDTHSRAVELWDRIKKKRTSGKMIEKQLELATQLVNFQDVSEELQAEKLQADALLLGALPKPAWLSDPTPQPHWSIEEARLAGEPGRSAGPGPGGGGAAAAAPRIADALKSMIILMHPTLLDTECMSGLGEAAAAAGARLRPDPAAPPLLVAFHRARDVATLQATDQSVHLSSASMPCLRSLWVLSCSQAVQLMGDSACALTRHAAALQHSSPGQLTLLINDPTNYFKKGKPHEALEEAKIDLQLSLGVDTLVRRGADELVALVLQVARALAEEPYKLSRRAADEQAEFYMRGDNKNCVTVDAQGNGLGRLWQQMLSVLPQSSLEVGRALAAHCPTPRALAQTVQGEAAAAALADVPVVRSAAPGARPRRLGRELANKLANIFTQPGDFKLDSLE